MGRKIQIGVGFTSVALPNGGPTLNAGDIWIVNDADFAALTTANQVGPVGKQVIDLGYVSDQASLNSLSARVATLESEVAGLEAGGGGGGGTIDPALLATKANEPGTGLAGRILAGSEDGTGFEDATDDLSSLLSMKANEPGVGLAGKVLKSSADGTGFEDATADVGAGGLAGPQGAPGVPGVQGVPGVAGSPQWSGVGPPGLIIGAAPGDDYLDLSSGVVYTLN